MAIARVCIRHSLRFEAVNLVGALFGRRHDAIRASEVDAFEREFADHVGARHCVAFPFARSAVHFALKSQGFSAGAEVIMPPITIRPMLDAVRSLGLVPVFVDLDPSSLIFDAAALREATTSRTAAVLITYLFGRAVDPSPLLEHCSAEGIFVIEDFSQALGASVRGRSLGTFGDVGVYSSSLTKTLDTYGGGLAVTDDDRLHDRLRVSQQGLVAPPRRRLVKKIGRSLVFNLAFRRVPWTIAFPLLRLLRRMVPASEERLTRDRVRDATDSSRENGLPQLHAAAFECFTTRQARVGLRQLPALPARDVTRRANAEHLRTVFAYLGVRTPSGSPGGVDAAWQTVVFVPDAIQVQRALGRRGVDSGTTNLAFLAGEADPERGAACPEARTVSEAALCIPSHERLNARGLGKVANALMSAVGRESSHVDVDVPRSGV